MQILIYGAGAVGLGIASCLLKAGEHVVLVARKDTVMALQQYGLLQTGIFGESGAAPDGFESYVSLDETPQKAYDYILVCTKSPDSQKAARDIAAHGFVLKDATRIVLFQNGWGNAEIFASCFPEERICNARVITGFCRPEKHHVDITVHADAIHMGSLYNSDGSVLTDLSELINRGGIPCEVTGEIAKDLWAKMLYNCALNPLGALLDVPYGMLGEMEYTRTIMDTVVNEIFAVMKSADYETHWKTPQEYLGTFYDVLLPATARHESSMLQDIHAHKKTEIEALNGAVVRLAVRVSVEVSCNRFVYNMIKFVEKKHQMND